MHAALLAEVCAQLVLLLFGQVGLNDLELLALTASPILSTTVPLSKMNNCESSTFTTVELKRFASNLPLCTRRKELDSLCHAAN
jgi:hypothetical protein